MPFFSKNILRLKGQIFQLGQMTQVALSRLVYPPICLSCGAMVERHGALCSECWQNIRFIDKPYCAVSGLPFAHDLGEGIVSADVIANPPPYKRARAAAVYTDMTRSLVGRLKYKDRADLAHLMALWMLRSGTDCLEHADVIVPVPLHRFRLWTRKYNQSAELARALSKLTKIEYAPMVLVRHKLTKPQVGLEAKARQDNVRGAFHVPDTMKDQILERNVVLIDDVFTTGATVEAATKALLRAGAGEVSVLTFARVLYDE